MNTIIKTKKGNSEIVQQNVNTFHGPGPCKAIDTLTPKYSYKVTNNANIKLETPLPSHGSKYSFRSK